jgi:hypothetical protein
MSNEEPSLGADGGRPDRVFDQRMPTSGLCRTLKPSRRREQGSVAATVADAA